MERTRLSLQVRQPLLDFCLFFIVSVSLVVVKKGASYNDELMVPGYAQEETEKGKVGWQQQQQHGDQKRNMQ